MNGMFRLPRVSIVRVAAVAVALAVAGCSGSAPSSTAASAPAGGVASATSTPVPVPTATETPSLAATETAPAASTTPEATGVATSLDPCQLYTAAEASQLTGATFGPGKESTTSGNGKYCTYGYQTLNVFEVIVAQAPDVATAQAERAAAESQVKQQAPGVNFAEVSGIGDNAAVVSASFPISGRTLSASGIYVLKGTTFFSLNDVSSSQPAPTTTALEAAAQVVVGRLP